MRIATFSVCGRMTYPFIDGHLCLVVDAQVFDLVNPPDALHVSSITTSTEDQCNTRVWVDVPRCDEGSGGVVDERMKLCGHILGAHTKDAARAPFEVCAVHACRMNKGDVEGAATAKE